MTSQEELHKVKDAAETTLQNLMNLLHRSPDLAAEIRTLISAKDQVQEYTTLAMKNPKAADQILRISLATLGNYLLASDISRQLDSEQS